MDALVRCFEEKRYVGVCLAHNDFLRYGLIADRGILQTVHFGERASPLRADLLLSADYRRNLLSVEPVVTGGRPGDMEGTMHKESRGSAFDLLLIPIAAVRARPIATCQTGLFDRRLAGPPALQRS